MIQKKKIATGNYVTYNLAGWIHEIDNETEMLRCPDCECRVTMERYLEILPLLWQGEDEGMTYEEAIKEIETIKSLEEMCKIAGLAPNYTLGTSKDVIDACTLAIQALKECHRQEQTFEWCHDCKEYDQEAHCCHRWSKIIGSTIADIKAEMASEIIEQIEKMRQKEPYHFLPNLDAYNLFQKIVEDYRDGKGAWAERKKE